MTIQPQPQPSHNWQNRGPTGVAASSSSSHPPSAHILASPSSQRRRSSAAHARPAVPPPNLPIPNVPVATPVSTFVAPREATQYELNGDSGAMNGEHSYIDPEPYSRPSPSPNLSAIASFARPRQDSASTQPSASTSVENLSDPPPRSFLSSYNTRVNTNTQPGNVPAPMQFLSPTESRPRAEPKLSSRRTLTKALELAKEAVALDGTDLDPHGAVLAYGKSVALLSEVMERVRRGEDSTETTRKPGRRRSVVAQEEEVRRLKAIHDTYADRMNILSLIYSIPPQPHSASVTLYSPTSSTDTTRPVSPSAPASSSASSEASSSPPEQSYNNASAADVATHEGYAGVVAEQRNLDDSGAEAIGVAMFSMEAVSPGGPSSQHPFAARHDTVPPASSSSQHQPAPAGTRSSTGPRRGRSSSILPPPPPPPIGSPPPPPIPDTVSIPPPPSPRTSEYQQSNRLRPSTALSHHRTGSGSRLGSLQEEQERTPIDGLPTESHSSSRSHFLNKPGNVNRDSHPLPPLPSPSSSNANTGSEAQPDSPAATPRNTSVEERVPARSPSPVMNNRSRNGSIASVSAQLINTSPSQGTISKRRIVKSSAPPTSMRPPSPTESAASAGSVGSVPYLQPAFSIAQSAPPRARAVSQPGRRPSNAHEVPYDPDDRPPLPTAPGINGFGRPRPSNQHGFPLVVQTDLAPSIFISSQPFSGAMPLTPTSPMPAAPPNDPLRKPYHMMNLLMMTMTSPTGGYITKRLHVPQEVWSQGGAKLANLSEKAKVVEVLSASLEELQTSSAEYFGAGNVCSGLALGIGSVGRKEGEGWVSRLDEFSAVCEGVVTNFGKKLGVGEGFVSKKTTGVTSWGSKLTRRFDKLTSGKNLDSPAEYVSALIKLFTYVQLIDEHTQAVLASPVAPAYAALPLDVRTQAEMRLRRSSEFFASVVLTFVIRDLSQLLDKYAKKCEKWLEE
jgi:hypothetical protein